MGRQLKMQTFMSWMVSNDQRRANYTASKRKFTNKERRQLDQKGITPKDTDKELLEY